MPRRQSFCRAYRPISALSLIRGATRRSDGDARCWHARRVRGSNEGCIVLGFTALNESSNPVTRAR